MTDREILAVIVAFSGTWAICVLLAFWVSDLRCALRELEREFSDFVDALQEGGII